MHRRVHLGKVSKIRKKEFLFYSVANDLVKFEFDRHVAWARKTSWQQHRDCSERDRPIERDSHTKQGECTEQVWCRDQMDAES